MLLIDFLFATLGIADLFDLDLTLSFFIAFLLATGFVKYFIETKK